MSDYYKSMDNQSALRYRQKISIINNIDPYLLDIKSCSSEISNFPKIMYPDIVNYLLYTKSAYTFEDLKAYKGLEAYKLAISGWVRTVHTMKCAGKVLILGTVMHSQRLGECHLKAWIVANEEGTILCAHCDCVAGLGETCTHVCAVLFSIDESLRKATERSVTDVKAYWTAPGRIGDPRKVQDIDFMSPNKQKEIPLFDRNKLKRTSVPELNKDDVITLLALLKETPRGSVLHSFMRPFSTEISESCQEKTSYMLNGLYKFEYEKHTLDSLKQIGSSLDLTIPLEACRKIEKLTGEQAQSKAWFHFRAGRITTSHFKSVCRTKVEQPSLSLLKTICYPLRSTLRTKATIYGCMHEKDALQAYTEKICGTHQDFRTEPVGLCLNPEYPAFGASPDGLVSCVCCGLGCIEIKCPFCAKDVGVDELSILKKMGLDDVEGTRHWKKDHTYYYQIQMQLAITRVKYCDFVFWSKKNICIERILFDEEFWNRESKLALNFYKNVILPELLSKYFTKFKEHGIDWNVVKHDHSYSKASSDV